MSEEKRMSLFTIDQDLCKRDGICVETCPMCIIEIGEEGGFPSEVERAEELCNQCGHCVAVCPHGALTLKTIKAKDCVPIQRKMLPGFRNLEHLLKSRRSIRTYKEKSVERETLARLINVARYGPSGHNTQPVEWLVIEDTEKVKRLAALVIEWMGVMLKEKPEIALPMHFDLIVNSWKKGKDRILRGAPHLIAAHGPKNLLRAQEASLIALAYLEIAAYSMGLGACWAGYFRAAAASFPPLTQAVNLPEGHQIFGAMMVGYPKHRYYRIPLRKEPKIGWQ